MSFQSKSRRKESSVCICMPYQNALYAWGEGRKEHQAASVTNMCSLYWKYIEVYMTMISADKSHSRWSCSIRVTMLQKRLEIMSTSIPYWLSDTVAKFLRRRTFFNFGHGGCMDELNDWFGQIPSVFKSFSQTSSLAYSYSFHHHRVHRWCKWSVQCFQSERLRIRSRSTIGGFSHHRPM